MAGQFCLNCNFSINRDFTFFSIVSELFNKKIDYCLHFSKKQFLIDYELFTPRIMQCFITNHEEPSFSVSRGSQETEYMLHFSHFMASIWERVDFIPPFHVLPMPVRAKGRWIFFFFLYPFNKGKDQERGWGSHVTEASLPGR